MSIYGNPEIIERKPRKRKRKMDVTPQSIVGGILVVMLLVGGLVLLVMNGGDKSPYVISPEKLITQINAGQVERIRQSNETELFINLEDGTRQKVDLPSEPDNLLSELETRGANSAALESIEFRYSDDKSIWETIAEAELPLGVVIFIASIPLFIVGFWAFRSLRSSSVDRVNL